MKNKMEIKEEKTTLQEEIHQSSFILRDKCFMSVYCGGK